MKKNISVLLLLIWTCSTIHITAQNKRERFSEREFTKQMESFIVKEACLSPAEATVFFPIFHEMHKKQRGLIWKIGELKKRTLAANAPDKEYYNIIKEINNLKIESAELEDTYYKKMCKAISAKKVHAAMKAEDKFHRCMLHKFSKFNEHPQKKSFK